MNKSKERAWEIINLYLEEIKRLSFVESVILVGSLSDNTYTGGPGSDIDLIHIVTNDVDYEAEKKSIFRLLERIEKETNNDVSIAKVVYQMHHLIHPYQYDFDLTAENRSLINRPIEVFRIIDGGITLFGNDIRDNIESPTLEDVLKYEQLNQSLMEIEKEKNPKWFQEYSAMKANPTIRIMTQIVLTTAMLEYFYYTGKSCSSKYLILERIEKDVPTLSYLNLLRLCHKNRFSPEKIIDEEINTMRNEYQNQFLKRPTPWKVEEI